MMHLIFMWIWDSVNVTGFVLLASFYFFFSADFRFNYINLCHLETQAVLLLFQYSSLFIMTGEHLH